MRKIFLVVILCASLPCFAGEKVRSLVVLRTEQQRASTGNLSIDFFGQSAFATAPPLQDGTQNSVELSRKSPWLAAGLSFVVPGAGEFYAENYWKAALFLAIDVAAWSLAYSFDKKGDDQTAFFQKYADEHWNVKTYAQYSFDNYLTAEQQNQYRGRLFNSSGATPREQVNWNVLNEMERAISATDDGKFYSHTLPPYGDQQYFELIGKYQQFYQGWNDADPSLRMYNDIVQKLNTDRTNFKYYSVERGKANDFYSTASTYVTVAIVNHVLSALDAAWTASTYNHNMHASIRMQSVPSEFGYTSVPVVRMEYSF